MNLAFSNTAQGEARFEDQMKQGAGAVNDEIVDPEAPNETGCNKESVDQHDGLGVAVTLGDDAN